MRSTSMHKRRPSAGTIFLDLAKQGKLKTDIWLVHLTGEEFPSDCMGARALCQRVVEGGLKIRLADGRWRSLAKTRVDGVYVMDMIAQTTTARRMFSRSPRRESRIDALGRGGPRAAEIWNASTPAWNRKADRRGDPRASDGRRHHDSGRGFAPALERRGAAALLSPQPLVQHRRPDLLRRRSARRLVRGELRDNRQGYHDAQHDGEHRSRLRRRVGGIAIESVARAAGRK